MAMPVSPADIAAAYRLLLDREPDPGGLSHYGKLAETAGLTTARLRETLLASEEYRSRNRQRMRMVDIGGAVVCVDPEDPIFGAAIAAAGDWEPHLQPVIAQYLAPGGVFVDVGANLGVMAFRAAQAVGPGGKVIAFEPDPVNANCFRRGLAANGFGNVTLHQFALSDAPAIFALQGASNAYLVDAATTDVMAQAVRGDTILAGEARIDFIKLDIEGHEPQALAGLAETLARHRPLVLCEFNPRCLRDHIGAPVAEFARQIFRLAPGLIAILYNGRETPIGDADALLEFWQTCNREASARGHLAEGMLHLDLLFRVGCAAP